MANKMLIDALHPEETRVVALRGNRVEDFDFESASKKPLRGNIYLAKVTRVEPSLQAAFIEYGGNRHGFLAFSEIHPDYYQIPVADRQALLEEEARAHREADEDHRGSDRGNGGGSERQSNDRQGNGGRRSRRHRSGRGGPASEKRADLGDETLAEQPGFDDLIESTPPEASDGEPLPDLFGAEPLPDAFGEAEPELPIGDMPSEAGEPEAVAAHEPDQFDPGNEPFAAPDVEDAASEEVEALDSAAPLDGPLWSAGDEVVDAANGLAVSDPDEDDTAAETDENGQAEDEEPVEQLGGDAMEDATYRAPRLRRHYKIQEVIKRRQILLVQVVKEERGNKGAALTTYLSLAGRYSVLMPNTARGGGISRKITDSDDRRRLKAIAQELEVPEGMGIILRTAGAARGETEVKRDFEYLLRMWETVRELTLSSSAPKLVYEEGSLIKRTIRDLYSKEVDEIWVSGEAGYREAKDYMRLLMPSHAKNVHLYTDPQPIFAKSGAEAQLDAMFSNHVTLKSGGYIVINQTEALVAIDVNSGRSTREHNIEDTAVRTNLEAADEVARQLRLRDLAGLIVVDFIDMEEGRNNRAVERRIKDALKNDRARIQIGRISHFGLLEMSRQRIRTGVLEGSTVICPHCAGAGTVRSTASIALHVLRVLEDTLIRSASHNLLVRTRTEVALYMLNQKRANLTDLEQRFGVTIVVMADGALTGTVYHAIERGDVATPPVSLARTSEAELDEGFDEAEDDALDEEMSKGEPLAAHADGAPRARDETEGASGDKRRRRRRRRRGRDRDAQGSETAGSGSSAEDAGDDVEETGTDEVFAPESFDEQTDPMDLVSAEDAPGAMDLGAPPTDPSEDDLADAAGEPDDSQETPAGPPRRRRGRRSPARSTTEAAEDTPPALESPVDAGAEGVVAAPRRSRRARGRAAEEPSLLGFEAPSADRDVGADTAQNHPAEVEPDSTAESTQPVGLADLTFPADLPAKPVDDGARPAAPNHEAVADEPPRPKRSGWWQRAKATLTGE